MWVKSFAIFWLQISCYGCFCRDNELNLPFFISIWPAMIRTIITWRSPQATCLTYSMLTSALFVEGLPLLKSSVTSSHPSMNPLVHSKSRLRDLVLSLYTCWSIYSACDRVFLNQIKTYQVYSLLDVHSLFLRAHNWMTLKACIVKKRQKDG